MSVRVDFHHLMMRYRRYGYAAAQQETAPGATTLLAPLLAARRRQSPQRNFATLARRR